MFKFLHRSLVLLLPYCMVRYYAQCVEGRRLYLLGKNSGKKLVSALLPYFFSATLQNSKPTDRTKLKYFLPYGIMAPLLKKKHGMIIQHPKVLFYSWMPYGLSLWWNEEDKRAEASKRALVTLGVENQNQSRDLQEVKRRLIVLEEVNRRLSQELQSVKQLQRDSAEEHKRQENEVKGTLSHVTKLTERNELLLLRVLRELKETK